MSLNYMSTKLGQVQDDNARKAHGFIANTVPRWLEPPPIVVP